MATAEAGVSRVLGPGGLGVLDDGLCTIGGR